MRKLLNRYDLSPVLTLAAGLALLAWVGDNPFNQDLFALAATYSLLALGMYIPFVLAGSLSMAYTAYLAFGGYAVALVATRTDWPMVAGYFIGAAASAVLAVVLGFATRRLSSFFLVAVTLLFAIAFEGWLTSTPEFSGGAAGIGGVPRMELFGVEMTRELFIPVLLVLVWGIGVLVDRLRKGVFGMVLRASRDVPVAVEASGVAVPTLRLVALGTGAAVASLGGSVFVTFNQAINPETFILHVVFLALFMPLLGGQSTAWGAILGALIVVQFTFNLGSVGDSGTLLFTIAVLVVLLIAPRGILGYLGILWRRLVPLESEKERTHGA
ncbi:MAG: branched-chain amino acid ABC transporter permease [Nocardiopsaceae bacterium]|nr:branched-chain amino acid ABC transporter permease [Nocardiopsaceae bacterium]